MARIFLFLLTATAFAFAQDAPVETPSPTPTPAAESAPEAPPAPPAELAPAGDPAPQDPATLVPPPEPPAPSPTPDTIPMEGQPSAPPGGAPLDTQDLAPNLPDAAFTDPNAIIPDGAPLPPALPTAVENTQEKERKISIRYREVRVQADRDPAIKEMNERSTLAKTDEDKRAALREYYRMLFKKMVSIDKSIADRCRIMEEAYIRRLAQERIEPTIPLNPPPTPAPLGN